MTVLTCGLLMSIVIILLVQALKKYYRARLLTASVLVAIAFIYVGFSLKGNPPGIITLESAVALIFYFMALTGYTQNNALGAIGIMVHGGWDIMHHKAWLVTTSIPLYWPTFCFEIDIITGIYFIIMLHKEKVHA